MAADNVKAKDTFSYFVDSTKYDTDQPSLTGAAIKAKVVGLDPAYQLILEAHGQEPDKIVGDNEVVSLAKDKGPRRFHTAPPATFGA